MKRGAIEHIQHGITVEGDGSEALELPGSLSLSPNDLDVRATCVVLEQPSGHDVGNQVTSAVQGHEGSRLPYRARTRLLEFDGILDEESWRWIGAFGDVAAATARKYEDYYGEAPHSRR
jgi:hypothetical protein